MKRPNIAAGKPQLNRLLLILAVGVVILLAAYLRFVAVAGTVVDTPYRADAAGYFDIAYNLNFHGVYSRTIEIANGHESAGIPDAYRTPGYPLFLSLFVHSPPSVHVFFIIGLWQALLGTLTVLLVFFLSQALLGSTPAVFASLLTAMSPHLVNAPVYILSETLFTFLLVALLLSFTMLFRDQRKFLWVLLGIGMLAGIAALVRPMLELFPVAIFVLLWITFPRRQAAKGVALVIIGFALVWTPWIARNYITLGRSGDSGTMLETMASGIYPDMEYNHDPRYPAAPDRQDPRYPEIKKSLGSIGREVLRRVEQDPAREIGWYLIGKPVTMWSWDMTDGGEDAFIYHVFISPYFTAPVFIVTHIVMQALHWLLVLLALAACIGVWPYGRRMLAEKPLFMARLVSLALFYNTAVLIIMTPWVRYSLPFLPLIYLMATACVCLLWRAARTHAARAAVAA